MFFETKNICVEFDSEKCNHVKNSEKHFEKIFGEGSYRNLFSNIFRRSQPFSVSRNYQKN